MDFEADSYKNGHVNLFCIVGDVQQVERLHNYNSKSLGELRKYQLDESGRLSLPQRSS